MLTAEDYNEAVELWADDAYRFALSCCGDTERSKDAVQEAFTRLWEHRKELTKERCKGFLILVTQRRLRDDFRHDKVVAAAHSTMAREQEPYSTPSIDYELSDSIHKAMSQLSEKQRTILTLHDIEGYSYGEIASILEANYREMQVAAFRARVKMKKLLLSD